MDDDETHSVLAVASLFLVLRTSWHGRGKLKGGTTGLWSLSRVLSGAGSFESAMLPHAVSFKDTSLFVPAGSPATVVFWLSYPLIVVANYVFFDVDI